MVFQVASGTALCRAYYALTSSPTQQQMETFYAFLSTPSPERDAFLAGRTCTHVLSDNFMYAVVS